MIKQLTLTNFRSHRHLKIDFEPLVILWGENATGKTNVLEAVYLLGTGESFRAGKIEEMVLWEEEVGHVAGQAGELDDEELQVTVTRGVVQGKRVPKRMYKVNGTGKLKSDFVGRMAVVLFRPEDLELLTGDPTGRRRFLNEILAQIDRDYARSLVSYDKALRRRNKLLDLLREGQVNRTAFAFWDQLLIKDGTYLSEKRQELIEAVNMIPSLQGKLQVIYDRSTISPQRLAQYAREEVAAGYTLVGPHKDDFKVMDVSNEAARDISIYGSRGEQRLAVLWLKEAQLAHMDKVLKKKPVLLLDDILSELDEKNARLIASLCRQQQTVVTTTEKTTAAILGEAKVVRLKHEE
jgi:DNA replication and repair protein RecF